MQTNCRFMIGFLCMPAVAFIGGALFLLQQFAGINGVLYFSSLTFQDVGITDGAIASLLVGLTNFTGLRSDKCCGYCRKLNYAFCCLASYSCQLVNVFRCTLCILLNG